MLAVAIVFFALHLLHLRADFPNNSPWSDWAKYTDEGWYGDAAIRHYLRGTWHLPGDFNPAAALPVWPLLEAIVFRFTGVGIVAARALVVAVFGCTMLAGSLLLARRSHLLPLPLLPSRSLLAAVAVALLLAVSPYFYVFSRMAVLEPLLVLLTLLALVAAGELRPDALPPLSRRGLPQLALEIAIGILVALMIGTKTTAVALVPAVAYRMASAYSWRWRLLLRGGAISGGVAALLWAAYYLGIVRPHYLIDFQYLFSANSYTGITRDNAATIIPAAIQDGSWMGTAIYWLFALSFVATFVWRRLRQDSTLVALLLWVSGYFAFLVYHANLQPRYYFVIAVPATLVVCRVAQHLLALQPSTAWALLPALLLLVATDGRRTLSYIRHPEYTFQNAAAEIGRIVESDQAHSHTVLSISGSDLSLMTGLPSICDDFGTMELEDRIAAYRPGWFVAWNYVEDDKMDALSRFYRLTRVTAIPAYDDPDRNLLIVYRLDPKAGVAPKRRSRPHPAPTRLVDPHSR